MDHLLPFSLGSIIGRASSVRIVLIPAKRCWKGKSAGFWIRKNGRSRGISVSRTLRTVRSD